MSTLAELLSGAIAAEQRPQMSKIDQVARLKKFAAIYHAPNTFKVGDLVTPRVGGSIKNAGNPHIVVEVLETPSFHFAGTAASSDFGNLLNVRVAETNERGTFCHWCQHYDLEPYTGDGWRPGDIDPA